MALDSDEPLRITAEDLANVTLPSQPAREESPVPGPRSYGTIADDPGLSQPSTDRGSILLQGWFYLGAAGIIGALTAWAVCEPAFVDGGAGRWGNIWMVPAIVMTMSIGFGLAESVVERSTRKALLRGVLAVPLGLVLGFILYTIANVIFNAGLEILAGMGMVGEKNPAFWLVRAIGWAVFGAAGGAVYGIVGQSIKKAQYGILGGITGAALGGLLFDPVGMLTAGGGLSRALGFALAGATTGAGIGLVESILKDRWLYVVSGPLAGKQFILYKDETTIGNIQTADIYLFKDPAILPRHAAIAKTGARVQIRALGPVAVNGSPVSSRLLEDGNLVQIGRYSFRYKERARG